MKIGLVRHFKVNTEEKKPNMTWKDYKETMEKYDHLSVSPVEVDLKGVEWNKCYASTLPRAITTAKAIYDGEIKTYEELKEIDMRVISEVRGTNDMMAWSIYSFLGWSRNKEKIAEGIDYSRARIIRFLDILEEEVEEDDNVLIVCHGMIMTVIEEELIKRGFSGEEDIVFPDNAELYLYER